MFKIIYPDRYFTWTITLVVLVTMFLWGAIERFAIEQDARASETIYLTQNLLQHK